MFVLLVVIKSMAQLTELLNDQGRSEVIGAEKQISGMRVNVCHPFVKSVSATPRANAVSCESSHAALLQFPACVGRGSP